MTRALTLPNFVIVVLACFSVTLGLGPRAYGADITLKPQWLGTPHDLVLAISRRDDQLWAVGTFGILLNKRTSPQWTVASGTNGRALLGIAFAPSGDGVAVGQQGLLMEAKAGSDAWKTRDVGVGERLFSVAASSAGEFLVVGEFGTILDRPAGSTEWHRSETKWEGEAPHLYDALFVKDRDAVVVGENETLVTVTDGKVLAERSPAEPAKKLPVPSATPSQIGTETEVVRPSLFAVTRCGNTLVAAGQQGLVLTKDVESKDWQNSTIDGKPDVYGLACLADGRLVAPSNGFLLVGTRQGKTWSWQQLQPSPILTNLLTAVLPVEGDHVFVAIPGGIWEGKVNSGND